MILLIDNYDSFSYNLYQLIGSIASDIMVVRNDKMSVGEIERLRPEKIVMSPGPGRPENAGICLEMVCCLAGRVPILGVCLGHQAICQTYGATIGYAKTLMHGKASPVKLEADSRLFSELPAIIMGGRYHSLAAAWPALPQELKITARDEDGEIMAVEHIHHELYGVQFHPESILTPLGAKIIANFLNR
ncbi:MAG: aminodeoxychorismate/anthranilate synthase component II [Syntrophomonadaceae bacterium]|jgi:anthranilate synthase component 2|nr:aminodeoxychorismate/anthranilate synthase component II [Syntrophomonadaceae bacterium]